MAHVGSPAREQAAVTIERAAAVASSVIGAARTWAASSAIWRFRSSRALARRR